MHLAIRSGMMRAVSHLCPACAKVCNLTLRASVYEKSDAFVEKALDIFMASLDDTNENMTGLLKQRPGYITFTVTFKCLSPFWRSPGPFPESLG